jgi:hypothetical protein
MLWLVLEQPNDGPQDHDENWNRNKRSDAAKAPGYGMGGKDDYVSRNVRGKQSSECKESDKVDRTRRHAQNSHEQPVECMRWSVLWRTNHAFEMFCQRESDHAGFFFGRIGFVQISLV